MRVSDLSPLWQMWEKTTHQVVHSVVDRIEEAHGVRMLCPKCFLANGGPVGTHQIICWSPKVPSEAQPGPGRWHLQGRGFEDLTLKGVSSDSVLLTGEGCGAHFFVRNGNVEMC